MSSDQLSHSRTKSSSTKNSAHVRSHTPPPSSLTPENTEQAFESCAATGSFFLYAQRNVILVLHHDTLAIERRFELHREDVKWITVDNVSERGAGRLAASYDAGHSTIVWDILTGREIARFAAYEEINTAQFMRNGNIAFGNLQGSVILFEPSTHENISARTIFDPITAIAPSADCRTFAIGYLNGSILIATLQPAFTILHTLTTSRAPSRITGLAWHGSSSKQKTDMLATQTAEGDLRVWSVPKTPHHEAPTIIRALGRSDIPRTAPCWFGWSKNGRIVQHYDGETRSWDVRTKRVTYDLVPTIEGVVGIASYGPTATLFTMGRNHTIQQYDISPTAVPLQVQSVQHMPANTPPTPPTTLEERKNPYASSQASSNTDGQSLPIISDMESSADEGNAMSPLQKIAREMDSLDQLESEIRDKITPLSPTSSRASSVSSRSSGGAHRQRKYLYDRPSSSRASTTTGYEGTEFSYTGEASKPMRDSMSIRSESTRASHTHFRSSSLRKEILRSPEEAKEAAIMDLFPYTKARLRDVALQTPHYGDTARTPEILQREMLSVVFGWNDTVETLIREEMARHKPGSASNVLLAKWLSDMGADSMAALVGSESMTSSDWMLLALSSIGQDSQKKVGEAFVQRLLEKGDIHPAVAILLGLGETHDAIEVYVSQGYFMEAILLTSLTTPSDWGRQTYLLRKWGEIAIRSGEPELAVRIFSCASIETTTAWSSPGAQNAVFAAQHQQGLGDPLSPNPLYSPPLSPPSRSGSGRLTAKNASLKLITTFGAKGAPVNATNDDPTPLAVGLTPILTSAMSPIGWRPTDRNMRAPSSARTATPGAYGKRRRLPSKSDATRTNQVDAATPLTAARDRSTSGLAAAGTRGRRTPSISDTDEPATALRPTRYDGSDIGAGPQSAVRLPSPSHGLFARSRTQSRPRQMSRDRHPDGLKVQIVETRYTSDALSPGPSTQDTSGTGRSGISRMNAPSPAMTNSSMRSAKTKAIDDYINSVEQARLQKRHARPESRTRGESRARTDDSRRADSRSGRATSRARDRSEARGRADVHYIKPPKRSPSSPVPMSPEEIAQANARQAAANDPEHFYKTGTTQNTQVEHIEDAEPLELTLQNMTFQQRKQSPDRSMLQVEDSRGRSDMRTPGSLARSPSTPLPSTSESRDADQYDDTQSDGRRIRSRAQSIAHEDLQTRRAASRSRPPVRSESCRSNLQRTALLTSASQLAESTTSSAVGTDTPGSEGHSRARTLTRKELAARELEERRLSLARRPSAPAIPMPNTLTIGRPRMSPRSYTELGDNPHTLMPPISRSQTADPEAGFRYGKINGTSTPSAPIGLPATPRAMKHPQYMGFDPDDNDVPPVPLIPDYASSLTGSLLSQTASSSLSQAAPSSLSQAGPSNPSQVSSSLVSEVVYDATEDTIAPLLPSTVFGKQGPQAPPRAASAPLEKSAGSSSHPAYKHNMPTLHSRRFSGGRGHVRKISPPEQQSIDTLQPGVTSIDEAIHSASDQHVIIVETDGEDAPIMLPELQHLAMPPPPPPPALYQYVNQRKSDHIEVVVDVNASTTGTANSGTASDLSQAPTSFPQFPYSMERASTASPQTHRRGHGSISESFGSRMRGVADRMRNGSRSRAKSPPMLESLTYDSPYETVLPPFSTGHLRRESFSRAKSPYEQAMAEQQNAMPPPPPPPPAPPAPGTEVRLHETAVPPRSQSATSGYRHPKAVRANMPPDHVQAGALGSGSTEFL